MTALASPPVWRGKNVDITTIERQLSNLWKGLPITSNPSPVRTHMFNLVAYASNQMQMERISRLTELARRHPSRSIILLLDRSPGEPSVDAEISIHCLGAPEGSASYCHEQIALTLRGRAADHPASVVVPLLMPELRTYLWWPGQPPFGFRVFYRLLEVADQLIVDSAQFMSPGDGLVEMARLSAGRYGINDMNWSRLTPWREMLAQCFDGAPWRPYLDGIRSIRLEFGMGPGGSASETVSLLLMLGWFGSRLGWQPETTLDGPPEGDTTLSVLHGERLIPIDVTFRDRGRQAAHRLMGMEVVSQAPRRPPARFTVERFETLTHVTASVEVHDECRVSRVVPLGIPSDDALLAEELELAGRDVLYGDVVREASRLAGREMWTPV